jgi:hypothetical protein
MKLINPISQILMVAAIVGGGNVVSWICIGAGVVLELGLALLLASDDQQ